MKCFNGADDNGSGTVTLMELARLFQTAVNRAERPERSIAFVWVAGEEKGLLGSNIMSTILFFHWIKQWLM